MKRFTAFAFLAAWASATILFGVLLSQWSYAPAIPGSWRGQRRDASADWKTPIAFYGKVVDENENPLADANIEFACNDLSREGTTFYKRKSDLAGRFEIKGIHGKYLAVHPRKPGYYSSKANPPGFMYAGERVNFEPNANRPVVFRLRRMGVLPHLLERRGLIKVPTNGEAVMLDLVENHSRVKSAPIIIKSNQAQNDGSGRFGWKLSITAPAGGGIQSAGSEFNFLAPQDGYTESVTIESEAPSSRSWQDGFGEQEFFIRLGDNYARLWVSYVANNGAFQYLALVNPEGSRNLEGPLTRAMN